MLHGSLQVRIWRGPINRSTPTKYSRLIRRSEPITLLDYPASLFQPPSLLDFTITAGEHASQPLPSNSQLPIDNTASFAPMSQLHAAFESLRATSVALVIAITHFFLNLWPTLCNAFSRKSRVTLTLNEHNSPVLDPRTGMTLFEMIGDKCPSLYGDNAFFEPIWWLPGYGLSRLIKISILTVFNPLYHRSGNIQTIWCVIAELFFRDAVPYQRFENPLPSADLKC